MTAAASARPASGGPTVRLVLLLELAGATAAGAAAIILTGGLVDKPDAYAALVAWDTVVFVGAGLFWLRRRPHNRLGRLLVALAFVQALQALQGSGNSLVHTLGVLADAPAALLAWYALLVFPKGRLDRPGRAAMALAGALVVFGFLPWLLTAPVVQGAPPLARCADRCPPNAFAIDGAAGAAHAFRTAMVALLVAVAVAVLAALAYRAAASSRPGRRTLLPAAAVGGAWVLSLGLYTAVGRLAGVGGRATADLGFLVTLTRALLPVAFLVTPAVALAYAATALTAMIRRLDAEPGPAARERILADVLHDPTLRVAYRLPRTGEYIDATGLPVEPPADGSGRAWTVVARGGTAAAALVHDPTLAEEPELVDAAARALLLSLESARAESELDRTVEELRRSRRRLAVATAEERRRLERELHDTAQQQLVALRVGLELARERAEANTALAERLAGVARELDEAITEVRTFAGDIYPTSLASGGLAAALAEAAREAHRPVELDVSGLGRYPADIEAIVYFCCVEALRDAASHAGPAARITLWAREQPDTLVFEIRHDSAGLAGTSVDGDGLTIVADRIAAIDGTLDVASAHGGGTVVTGSVPLHR